MVRGADRDYKENNTRFTSTMEEPTTPPQMSIEETRKSPFKFPVKKQVSRTESLPSPMPFVEQFQAQVQVVSIVLFSSESY